MIGLIGIRPLEVIASIMVLALHLGGCIEPTPDETSDDDPNVIETNLSDPFALLDSFEKAFNTRNLEAYAALLDAEFMHYPLERDAEDFPWLQGDSWDKATELEELAILFDPSYSGPPHPLFREECALTALTAVNMGESGIELTCTAQARVLTPQNDVWSFDSRLLFTLINRDGFWRIWKLTELDTAGNVGNNLRELSESE